FGGQAPSQQFQAPPAPISPQQTKPGTPDWGAATGAPPSSSMNARPAAPSAINPSTQMTQPGTMPPGKMQKNARAPQMSKHRLVKQSPHRAELLGLQTKLRDEQNKVAQSLRGSGTRMLAAPAPPGFGTPLNANSQAAAARANGPNAVKGAKTQDELAKM